MNLIKIQIRFKDLIAVRLLLIGGLVGLSLTLNAQITASGGESAINVTTAESQRMPAISMNSEEQYVITWQSWAQDGDGWGVYASTFDLGAGTNPVSETLINNGQTIGSQLNPDAAMASDGDFVVVYQGESIDADGWGIYFSMLTINGTRNISDLILNQTVAGNQRHPAVAVTNSNSYVVVWESEGQIYGRLINSTGAISGSEFQVSGNDVGVSHLYPDVATKADGSFVVAWQAINESGQSFIVAREMNSAGVAVADAFGVSSDSTLNKANPAIATSSGGEYVITWSQYISETNVTDVFATKYDNSGSVAVSEFRVNAGRSNAQNQVDVGMTDAGAMVFSYTDFDKDGDKAGVFLDVFDDEGSRIVSNMQLNATTDDYQMSASIAFNTDNGPLIGAWQDGLYASDTARDGSGYGIYSREFAIADITKPTVVTQDLTVYLNSAGEANITAADVDGGSTDNVGINSFSINTSVFSCADLGENDVVFTASDAVGNAATGNATITVVDSVRPTVIAQDVSLILDAAGFASITVDDIDNGSSDNCSISKRTLSKTNYDFTNVGVNIVELEIADASSNVRTATAQVTISKRGQAITFGALANATFGDAPFNLTATTDSGLGIAYTSSDENVVTISGNTVTIVGAGTANITASQAGTNIYNAATDVIQSITVDKAEQVITFNALANVTQGDPSFDLVASGGASGNTVTFTSSAPLVASVSGNTVTIGDFGTTTITASQSGNDDYEDAVNVTQMLTVDKLFIWNGAAWNNPGIPSAMAGDRVRIDGNYTVSASGIFSASELNVTVGNTLLVDSEETLIVEGDLNSDGLLHITSGSSLVPATLPSAEVTGTGYQIDRTTTFDTNTGRYSIVGSPVKNAGFGQLGGNALVYGYDESELYDPSGTDGLDRFKTPGTLSQTVMAIGQGYFSAFTGDLSGLIEFSGTPNFGDINVDLSYTDHAPVDEAPYEGFNLVSNPYAHAVSYSSFMTGNGGAAISGSVYLWDDDDSETGRGDNADYLVVNAMGNTDSRNNGLSKWDGNIRSGQGFFVQATANTTITFEPAMIGSSNSDGGFFRSDDVTVMPLKLILDDGFDRKATIVGFADDASDGLDSEYDAPLLSEGKSGFYSLLSDRAYAIQGLPSGYANEIPMGFIASQDGEYSIAINQVESTESLAVIFLKDMVAGTIVDLRQGAYSFNATKGRDDSRFLLQAIPKTITDLDDDLGNEIYSYSDQDELHVVFKTGDFREGTFILHDLNGRELFNQNTVISNSRWSTGVSQLPTNIYLLTVKTEKGVWREKVMIK